MLPSRHSNQMIWIYGLMIVTLNQSLLILTWDCFSPDIPVIPECDSAAQHRGRSADGAGPLLIPTTSCLELRHLWLELLQQTPAACPSTWRWSHRLWLPRTFTDYHVVLYVFCELPTQHPARAEEEPQTSSAVAIIFALRNTCCILRCLLPLALVTLNNGAIVWKQR